MSIPCWETGNGLPSVWGVVAEPLSPPVNQTTPDELPLEARMAELQRRYDQFIAEEDHC
jgi:hypothetical protein